VLSASPISGDRCLFQVSITISHSTGRLPPPRRPVIFVSNHTEHHMPMFICSLKWTEEGRGYSLGSSVLSGVDNEDDPKGLRLDDHDPIAHEEVIIPAPSGINLHHSRRQHNDRDGSRYDRADVQ
jgi:hypothetical protein